MTTLADSAVPPGWVVPRLDARGNGPSEFLRSRSQGVVNSFLEAVDYPEVAQTASLQRVLASLRGTEVERRFGLEPVRTLAELRERAPVRSSEDHRPDLERVWAGEQGVVTNQAVQRFVVSSGTTGAPKRLPITATRARVSLEAQALWLMAMVREQENVTQGKALTVVGRAAESRSPTGLVVGSNTGRLAQGQSFWVRSRLAVPDAVFDLLDAEVRTYVLLRHALAQPVSSITTANPSTLLALARAFDRHREDLTRDLADGTLRHGPAKELGWRWWRPARRRRVLPPGKLGQMWPLRTINCWKGGAAGFYVARLPEVLGVDVPVREVGISASEGFMAVPLHSTWTGGVAFAQGHLLEFAHDSGVSSLHELEVGARYRLVISTTAGLLRYDLDDYVEVVGRYGRLPVLNFVGKGVDVSSLTGEKLTATQLAEAMVSLSPSATGFAALAELADPAGYRVVVDGPLPSPEALDRALRRLNPEWAGKRDSDRLRAPEVVSARAGAFEALRRERLEEGAAEGQVKDPVFVDAALFARLVGETQ